MNKSGIHIKPGSGASTATKKQAQFAKNAKKFKH